MCRRRSWSQKSREVEAPGLSFAGVFEYSSQSFSQLPSGVIPIWKSTCITYVAGKRSRNPSSGPRLTFLALPGWFVFRCSPCGSILLGLGAVSCMFQGLDGVITWVVEYRI